MTDSTSIPSSPSVINVHDKFNRYRLSHSKCSLFEGIVNIVYTSAECIVHVAGCKKYSLCDTAASIAYVTTVSRINATVVYIPYNCSLSIFFVIAISIVPVLL